MQEFNPAKTTASVDRAISLMARSDLALDETWYQHERSWVVKDPLALKFYRLREPEHVVFQMLNGRNSLEQIRERLLQRFPNRMTRIADVQQLIASLNRQGLLVTVAPGMATPILEQADKLKRQRILQLMSSALSLRLPGIDPDPFLSRIYPFIKCFFSTWCTILCLLVSFAAGMLILANLDVFVQRLPALQDFFALQNVVAMGLLLIATKTIHELGHGLVCKHFGGECHEIGFMFLVMMPAMYCDTSDSWRLPNKWHRMAIGAAGMYVEIVLAALCTFIWWNTHPGWLNYLCLNVMFLCSVTTLLFNGNPLLRYDGYYILSDWLEVPNLSQKSKTALTSKSRQWILGMEPINERLLPQQHKTLFAIYCVASFVYRWFILVMILWFLSEMFRPWGLQAIGYFLVGMSLIGMVGVPLWKLTRFFSYPGRFRQVKKLNLISTSIVLALVTGVVFLIPFAYYVDAHCVVQVRDAQQVHVRMAGIIESTSVREGQQVEPGQLLARLRNTRETVRLQRLKGRVALLEQDIARLNQLATVTTLASSELVSKNAELLGARRQLQLQAERLEMLEIRADCAGFILPAPNVPEMYGSDPLEPVSWNGSPLEPRNLGATLEKDTLLCSIGNSSEWEIQMHISQSDISLIQVGQKHKLWLDEFSGQKLEGRVRSISDQPVSDVPAELKSSSGGRVDTRQNSNGNSAPLLQMFQAHADIDQEIPDGIQLMHGFKGRAKIHVGEFTLAWRVSRFINSVFNF